MHYFIIECYSAERNSHAVDRVESWVVKRRSAEDPRRAVVEYNRAFSDMVRLCNADPGKYEDFCFNPGQNYHRLRAFLDYPDLYRIRELLRADGVHVALA